MTSESSPNLPIRRRHTRSATQSLHRLGPQTHTALRAQDPFKDARTCNKLRPVYRCTGKVK